jgi:hypothetical protein
LLYGATKYQLKERDKEKGSVTAFLWPSLDAYFVRRFRVTAAFGAGDEDAAVSAALSLGPLDWLWAGFNGTLLALGAQVIYRQEDVQQ